MAVLFSPSVRSELLRLKSELASVKLEIKFRQLLRAIKFDPDQPRVPAGNPDGGQWTGESDAGGRSIDSTRPRSSVAAMSKRAECEVQWKRDIFHCNMVGSPTCYAQAMVRLVACEKGHSIPPLNY